VLQKTFAELVEDRLSALNTNAFAVEQAHGLTPDAVRNVLRRGSSGGPTLARAAEICGALGLEFYIGPRRLPPGFAEGDTASDLGRVEALRAGFLPIPWHHAANRRGAAPVAFAAAWLELQKLRPDDLLAVVPDKAPVLPYGREVLAVITTSAKRAGPPSPWAIRSDGLIYLLDVEFHPRAMVLLKFMTDGSTRILIDSAREAVQVLGKVVWWGGLL
jgi:hypothetical protein